MQKQQQQQQTECSQPTTIPYVVNGCFVQDGQSDLLNARIQQRYQTDVPLAPSFDPRPVQTRYTRFGISDEYRASTVEIEPDYYCSWTNGAGGHQQPFVTTTRNGPPLAYLKNIEKETALQRQGAYAFNSKNPDEEICYQPPETSELYKITTAKYSGYGGSGEMLHNEATPYLFKRHKLRTKRQAPQDAVDAQIMSFNNPTLPRGTAH